MNLENMNIVNEDEKTYEGMRLCSKCFKLKTEEQFKKHHLKGYRYICRACYNIKRIKYNKTYYEKVKARRAEKKRLKKEAEQQNELP